MVHFTLPTFCRVSPMHSPCCGWFTSLSLLFVVFHPLLLMWLVHFPLPTFLLCSAHSMHCCAGSLHFPSFYCVSFPQPFCCSLQKISIYVFPEKELRGLSPNFHTRTSASDLYFTRIGPPIFLQQNRQTDRGNI